MATYFTGGSRDRDDDDRDFNRKRPRELFPHYVHQNEFQYHVDDDDDDDDDNDDDDDDDALPDAKHRKISLPGKSTKGGCRRKKSTKHRKSKPFSEHDDVCQRGWADAPETGNQYANTRSVIRRGAVPLERRSHSDLERADKRDPYEDVAEPQIRQDEAGEEGARGDTKADKSQLSGS
ncbi:hypothetical protein EG329_008879 [Mollisiaceae sp. DMI_Dod_QoI]|nr:hypothetical protein EG329_008879 [Helotiales sp. DMI_Dod_QoI]